MPQVRKAFVWLQRRPAGLHRGREPLRAGPSWTSPCVPSTPPRLPCGTICVHSLQGDLYFHPVSRASHTGVSGVSGVSSLGLGVNPFLFGLGLPEHSGLLPRLWSSWPEFNSWVCYFTVLSFGTAYLPLSTCFLIQKMGSIMVVVKKTTFPWVLSVQGWLLLAENKNSFK